MILLNAWYVACTPAEIDDKPLGRTLCKQPIVFYRAGDGTVAALDDFCPHRSAPLSLGRVIEGKLVCGYHGLEMGCDGKTIAMPGQRVRAFPAIRSYPVVERHGFVWVWPGEAALADPAAIPACAWADSPDGAYGGGLFHIGCDYRLMVDNLMDLSHETCVHATSIGQKEIDETPITPETETSIWYFWGMARNFNARDKALTASIREGQAKIFSEDLEMLERQQRNLLAWPEPKLLSLNIDAGGVRARRAIKRLHAAEQAGIAGTGGHAAAP